MLPKKFKCKEGALKSQIRRFEGFWSWEKELEGGIGGDLKRLQSYQKLN